MRQAFLCGAGGGGVETDWFLVKVEGCIVGMAIFATKAACTTAVCCVLRWCGVLRWQCMIRVYYTKLHHTFRDVAWLDVAGMWQVEKGNTGVPMSYNQV